MILNKKKRVIGKLGQLDVLRAFEPKDEILGEKADEMLKSAVELKMGEGIAGWVAQNRESVLIEDVQNDPRFSSQADHETGFVTRTILCVPLLYGGDLLGVINVLNSKDKPGFDPFDEEILECFADLASTAIMRSRFLDLRLTQERIQIEMKAAANIRWQRP